MGKRRRLRPDQPGFTLETANAINNDGQATGQTDIKHAFRYDGATGGGIVYDLGTLGAAHMQGDADGDQDVDGTDFLAWQQQFGQGASRPAVPIPEPRAICLACLALAGVVTTGANLRAADRRA